jgi:hypothetical protein
VAQRQAVEAARRPCVRDYRNEQDGIAILHDELDDSIHARSASGQPIHTQPGGAMLHIQYDQPWLSVREALDTRAASFQFWFRARVR